MVRKTIILTDIEGMHARNSAKVSMLCKKSSVRVRVSFGEKTADGRDFMELMSLGALYRDELTLEADGPGEEEMVTALEQALNGTQAIF